MSAAVQDSAQTIGTSAVALGSNGFVGRAGISIYNTGGGTIYVGGPNVAIGTGIALGSNNYPPYQQPLPQNAAIYAISTNPGTVVRIIEF